MGAAAETRTRESVPARVRLPGSPIVARPVAELGRDYAPPKMYEAPKPDPNVAATRRVVRSTEQPQQRTVNRQPLDQPQPQPQSLPQAERAAPQPQPQPRVERAAPQPQRQLQVQRAAPQPQRQIQAERAAPQPQPQPRVERAAPQPQPGVERAASQPRGNDPAAPNQDQRKGKGKDKE